MAVSIYDYVPDATPDYDYTLSVDPTDVMYIGGEKAVEIHKGRGVSEERVILSDQTLFQVKLCFSYLSEDDHSTLFSLYHDSSKACGAGNSFKWTPPGQYSSHTLVVRFGMSWESFLQNYQNYGIANLILVVLGRVAE